MTTNSNTAASRATRQQKLPKGLWLHGNGQYVAKIKGHFRYYGTDREEAVKEFNHTAPYERRGEVAPPRDGDSRADYVSIDELVQRFLAFKFDEVQKGFITNRMYECYRDVCKNILEVFGRTRAADNLTPSDFRHLSQHLAKRYSIQSLANRMTWIRTVFRFGERATIDGTNTPLLQHAPAYGLEFDRPPQEKLEAHRESKHSTFSHEELLTLLEGAGPSMKAMLLLACNGALGQYDIANLPWSAIDLETKMLVYPRSKTAGRRTIPLWPETVKALREWQKVRPAPASPEDSDIVFLTFQGRRFVRASAKKSAAKKSKNQSDQGNTFVAIDAISGEFAKLEIAAGVTRKTGRGFYRIRHTVARVMRQTGDTDATKAIMGHKDSSMLAKHYVLNFDDEARLHKVTNHVRRWLFGTKKQPK